MSSPTTTLDIDGASDGARLSVELMPDGRLRAPLQTTREMLRERLRRAELLKTGPEWAVLRTVDAPAHGASPESPARRGREVVAAGVIGERGLSLVDFLGFLATGQETGIVSVAHQEEERALFLLGGDLVYAASSVADERLGAFLYRRGRITGEQLQALTREGERRVGRASLERGFISPGELAAMVRAQVLEIFDQMIGARTGLWSFMRADSSVFERPPLRLPTQGVLVDALRRQDELMIFRQRVRGRTVTVQRVDRQRRGPLEKRDVADVSSTADLVEEMDESLKSASLTLLGQLPRAATIEELMRILGQSEFEVTRSVYHLLRRNMVEIVKAPDPPADLRPSLSPVVARELIGTYGLAIHEMLEEVGRVGKSGELRLAAERFAQDESQAHARFLRSVLITGDGGIDPEPLLRAIEGTDTTAQALQEGLSELLFFVLFQATEMLGRRRGDDLARRVKLILGMPVGAGGAP